MTEFQPDNNIDLRWLFERNPQFKKYFDQVEATKADEQRYRDHPGYVPVLEAKGN